MLLIPFFKKVITFEQNLKNSWCKDSKISLAEINLYVGWNDEKEKTIVAKYLKENDSFIQVKDKVEITLFLPVVMMQTNAQAQAGK